MLLLLISTVLFLSPLLYLRYCKEAFSAPKNIVVFSLLSIVFLIMAFKYLSQKIQINAKVSAMLLIFALYAFGSAFYSVNPVISFRWALEFTFYAGLFAAVVHISNGNKNVYFGLCFQGLKFYRTNIFYSGKCKFPGRLSYPFNSCINGVVFCC